MTKKNKADTVVRTVNSETFERFTAIMIEMTDRALELAGDPDTFRFEPTIDYADQYARLTLEFQRPETDKEERDREQYQRDNLRRDSEALTRLARQQGFDLVPKNQS